MKDFTEKQIEIIKTALDIISTEGVKKANFRIIAKKLNVTEPAIYRHFENKANFIQSLYIYIHQSFQRSIKVRTDQSLSFEERLYWLLITALSHLEQSKGVNFILMAYSIYKNDSSLLKLINSIIGDYRSQVRSVLLEAIENCEIPEIDTEIHSAIITGLTQAFVINRFILGSDVSPENYASEIMKSYVKGLRGAI